MRLASAPAILGRLGSAEVAILVACAGGTVGALWLPGQIGGVAGAGTELAYLVEAGLFCLSLATTVAVVRRRPGRRMLRLLDTRLPRAMSTLLCLALAALDTVLAAFVLCVGAVTLRLHFLPLTPLWAVELLLLLPAAYAAAAGIEPFARTLDVAAPVTLLVLVATAATSVSQSRHASAALPHLPASGGIGAVLTGAYAGVWALGALTVVPNVCAQLAPAQAGRLGRSVAVGAAVALAIGLGLLALDLSVLGVTGLSWYAWPTVSVLRQTRSEAFLMNRVSGLDEGVMVVTVWAFVALHAWNALTNLSDLAAARRAGRERARAKPSKPSRTPLLMVVGAVYGMARLFGAGAHLDDFSVTYLDPAVLVLAVGVPLFVWLIEGRDRTTRGWADRGGDARAPAARRRPIT